MDISENCILICGLLEELECFKDGNPSANFRSQRDQISEGQGQGGVAARHTVISELAQFSPSKTNVNKTTQVHTEESHFPIAVAKFY